MNQNQPVQIGQFLVGVDSTEIAVSLLGSDGEIVDQFTQKHDFGGHRVSIVPGALEVPGEGDVPIKVPGVQVTAAEFESCLHMFTSQGERICQTIF